MAEGLGHCTRGGVDRVLIERARHLPGEDVAGVLEVHGDVGEGGLAYAEVLGQYFGGRVREPVGDQERLVLREVARVEDQQELAALLECLDRVWEARREVPEGSLANVVDKVTAPMVDEGTPGTSGKHV